MLGWWVVEAGYRVFDEEGSSYVCGTPEGVTLRVQEAEVSEPFFRPQEGWEQGGLYWVQVMRDGGRYRMWYLAEGRSLDDMHICYAESEDGSDWRRPSLGLVAWDGSAENNLCFKGRGSHSASVFIDPTAPATERYKSAALGSWNEDEHGNELGCLEAWKRRRERDVCLEPNVFLHGKVFGWTSPDGIAWTRIEPPLLDHFCDTHNVVTYDEARQSYVAYVRTHGVKGRCVGRCEMKDFRVWPKPTLLFRADDQDPPDTSVYGPGYTLYPGRSDLHLMFPHIYHHAADTVDIHLATSPDGIDWYRPERKPVIPSRPEGEEAWPCVYPGISLLAPDQNTFMLPVVTGSDFHNQGYVRPEKRPRRRSEYRWATWPRDRLVGIEAEEEGEFTLKSLPCSGQPIHLNYRTQTDGWIRVELMTDLGSPLQPGKGLAGYRMEECLPLGGDSSEGVVRWRGGTDVSALAGQELLLRVRMHRAILFAVTV